MNARKAGDGSEGRHDNTTVEIEGVQVVVLPSPSPARGTMAESQR